MLSRTLRKFAARRSLFATSWQPVRTTPLPQFTRKLSFRSPDPLTQPFIYRPTFLPLRPPHQPHTISRSYAQQTYRGFGERGQKKRSNFSALWASSRNFQRGIYVLIGGGSLFIALNIERVPGSGRLRFNCVSPALEAQLSSGQYESLLQQFQGSLLPPSAPEVQRVRRILERLLPHANLDFTGEWTVDVVRQQEPNAFVMPGGHVFVFTGILPLCQDDSGLATVLGHEIAHAAVHHTAEQLSRSSLLLLGAFAFSLLYDVSNQLSWYVLDLALNRPGSRAQESEADHLGLLIMARSCFDPQRAKTFWADMQRQMKDMQRPPQWLSSHPSDETRLKAIDKWMPAAIEERSQSACGETGGFMEQFKRKSGVDKWDDEEVW